MSLLSTLKSLFHARDIEMLKKLFMTRPKFYGFLVYVQCRRKGRICHKFLMFGYVCLSRSRRLK